MSLNRPQTSTALLINGSVIVPGFSAILVAANKYKRYSVRRFQIKISE